MKIRPLMDIHFPGSREGELLESMKSNAADSDLWQWQSQDPFGRSPESGKFYFHRDANNDEPSCTLCILRKEAGHFIVHTITPDKYGRIPIDHYVSILNDFDTYIAGPAADTLSGMTAIGTSKHTLNDYFSQEAIRLLKNFCTTSNGDGSHPADQDKWRAFLIHAHRNNDDVHCDTFGACLKEAEWWPEESIPQLVHEYDFAMELLHQYDQ